MNKKLFSFLLLAFALFAPFAFAQTAPGNSTPFLEELANDPFWSLPDFRVFLVYAVAGTVGVIGNYVNRWLKGEIAGNLFTYLFVTFPKATVATGVAFYTTALTIFLSGQLDNATLGNLCLTGFLAGYAIDNVVNKGDARLQDIK